MGIRSARVRASSVAAGSDAAGVGSVSESLLQAVSASRQALCITHLPQIAAMGRTHWYVDKAVEGERTRSRVTVLDTDGRVDELARMLGGAKVTKTTRAHAQELLQHAQKG